MNMRWFLLVSGFSIGLVFSAVSTRSQTNVPSEAQFLDPSEVLHKDGMLRISDGSSYYEFKTNGTFRSFPVGMSGRCFDGTWTSSDDNTPYASRRFTVEARSSWMNGGQPPPDKWTITFVVYAGHKRPEERFRHLAFFDCYFIIDDLRKIPQSDAPANGAPLVQNLDNIIIPEINYHEAKLSDIFAFLSDESRRLDPKHVGVNIIPRGEFDEKRAVTISLRNVPTVDAVKYVCQLAGLSYRIEPSVVIISKSTPANGASTAAQASVPSQTESQDLESRCLSFHMEHHLDDEQAGKVAGAVEFTGYKISVGHVEAGEAVVGIKVVSHKYIGNAPYPQLLSTEDVDWRERWRNTKDGWVFIERVSEPSWVIIYR